MASSAPASLHFTKTPDAGPVQCNVSSCRRLLPLCAPFFLRHATRGTVPDANVIALHWRALRRDRIRGCVREEISARLDAVLSVVDAAVEQLHFLRLQLVAVQFANAKRDFQFFQAGLELRASRTEAQPLLLLPESQPAALPAGGHELSEAVVAQERREGFAKFDGFR